MDTGNDMQKMCVTHTGFLCPTSPEEVALTASGCYEALETDLILTSTVFLELSLVLHFRNTPETIYFPLECRRAPALSLLLHAGFFFMHLCRGYCCPWTQT